MQRSHAHPSCVSRSARWASSSQSLSPTSNKYTLAHSVAGALHCHGGRCRDGPTDSLLPGVRCQTRQLGAQGFWFLFFSFLLPSRRAHAACKRRRTPRVCCGDRAHGDRAHVHAHDEQRPQPRSPTLPPWVGWLDEKASPGGNQNTTINGEHGNPFHLRTAARRACHPLTRPTARSRVGAKPPVWAAWQHLHP